MSNNLLKHLPWAAPTLAILAVGSGFMDRINISFGNSAPQAAQIVPEQDAILPQIEAAAVALAAVTEPETAPTAPAAAPGSVSAQVAELLVETEAATAADVEVARNTGFSLDILEQARDAALAEQQTAAAPTPPQSTATGPVGADFFSAAQANLERDRRCVDDLRALSAQARVYFPSGGLTGEQ